MLSRVADSLYWMSRYLERAEHTARLLDVNLKLMLDQSPASAGRRWRRLLASLNLPADAAENLNAQRILEILALDPGNRESVVACVAAARENARQVREAISSEMWEQLNRLFLLVKRIKRHDLLTGQPHEFFAEVKEGSHLFQGITDATMSHNEGWQFIQVGRFLERARATALLLDVHFREFLKGPEPPGDLSDFLEWTGLLKSCTAFEAYCKVHTADLRPQRIAEFLLLNPELPRSVHFAARQIHAALQAIARSTETKKAGRLERLAGRFQATLEFGQIDEILAAGWHSYLEEIQRFCTLLHTALYHLYITYPIDAALAS